jgi:hypothetical protein
VRPTTKFAKLGNDRVGYQVLGDGPIDLVFLTGMSSHLDFRLDDPERTVALVLAHTAAKYVRTDDYPHGWAPEVAEQLLHMVEELWGTDGFVSIAAPSRSQDEGFRQRCARYLRAAARPREAAAQLRNLLSADVRHVLPLIHCPTLILNRTGYRLVTTDHARYLAEHIPDARLVELPGTDGVLVTEHAAEILDSIEEFLSRVPGGSVPDRVLATVLFTDIVNSTDLAASSGDRRWKAVLETHDEITRDQSPGSRDGSSNPPETESWPRSIGRGAVSARPGRSKNRSALSGSTSAPDCMPRRSSCARADIVWGVSLSTSPLGSRPSPHRERFWLPAP